MSLKDEQTLHELNNMTVEQQIEKSSETADAILKNSPIDVLCGCVNAGSVIYAVSCARERTAATCVIPASGPKLVLRLN